MRSPIGVTDADGGDDVRALVMWRRLVGLAILALGDQASDLDGGFAEKTYKLPTPST
jgi:hypothetical protein